MAVRSPLFPYPNVKLPGPKPTSRKYSAIVRAVNPTLIRAPGGMPLLCAKFTVVLIMTTTPVPIIFSLVALLGLPV